MTREAGAGPKRLNLDPGLGDAIVDIIERESGQRVHVVLIVCPLDGEKLGQPEFVTSLQRLEMEDALVQIAGNFALIGGADGASQ